MIWSAGLSIATQSSSFILSFALARLLGKAVFGEWGMIQNTVISVAGIAQLSMAVTATRFIAEYRTTNPRKVEAILALCSWISWGMGLLATLLLFASAGWIATSSLHAPHLEMPLRISAIYLLFLTVNGYQIGALIGFELFKPLTLIGAYYGTINAGVTLVLAWKYGLLGAMWGMSLASLLSWLAHHRVLSHYYRAHQLQPAYGHLGSEAKVLFAFALPATLSGIAGSLGLWLSNLFLVRSSGGYPQMAAFAAASSFKSLILFVPGIIARVSTPLLVNLKGGADFARFENAFSKNFWFTSAAAAGVASVLALFAPTIMLLFGKSFQGDHSVLAILAVATVFEASGAALYQRIFTAGWMWRGLSIVIARSLILILGSYYLAPQQGAAGVAWANLMAHAFAALAYPMLKAR